MHCRPLRESDIPILRKMAADSGFPYPDLDDPLIESVIVVVDSSDVPIMACAAKRLVELYLYVSPQRPAIKMKALELLHQGMAQPLRDKLYTSAEAFLPENVAAKFGRRLERTFRWMRNWPSWTIRF